MENSSQGSFRASPNYVHRRIAGQHVLVSIGGNIADFNGFVQLNETAAFLWEQLREPKTADGLVSALTAEFEVTAEQAAADVKDFLAELRENDMVSADG